MSQVGFPGFSSANRRTLRGPVNPLDKATVVSIIPKLIVEYKHTIQPGKFVIEPGTYEKPSLLVVGPSSWWKELEDESPLLEIPVSSIQIADSIVDDYCRGLLLADVNARPGLFFIQGSVTVPELKTKHVEQLNEAKRKQNNWFSALVNLADSLWARTNGNPLAIGDDMRLAATELGLKGKEWLQDFKAQEMIKCVGCGNMRNPLYPICPSCHNVIDVELFRKLNILGSDKVK